MSLSGEHEIVDIVDEQDRVIGQKHRAALAGEYVRVVNVFLKNSAGQLWIPRRSGAMGDAPHCLVWSLSEYLQHDEGYVEALKRALRVMLNLELGQTDCRLLGYLTPYAGVSSFMTVYEIQMDETPNHDSDEIADAAWLSPAAVIARIHAGEPARNDLLRLLQIFYS